MDTVTRRKFLIASGVTGAGALAAGAVAIGPHVLAGRAESATPSGDRIVVLVTMYGGNDGLNTVVPYSDPAYQKARPDLAYDEGDVHVLGDGLGLNPSLGGLAGLWSHKQLAIVRGVGYPDPDLSHFRSMDIWQTASPSDPLSTGWIGRWLDATGDDPVRAVNVGTVLPPAAVGARCTAAALDASGDDTLPARFTAALTALGVAEPSDPALDAAVRTSYRNERTVASAFAGPLSSSGSSADSTDEEDGDSLASQLDFVGRCVKAGVPTRVYLVSIGNFDTHANEKGTQEGLLKTFDAAVSQFVTDMAGDPRGRNVVLMAYSEFGRRVVANASDGTDHGTAGPVFVAGAPVRAGFHGEQPSLTELDSSGNMRSTVDFRALYGELLGSALDTDPHEVLDTVPDPVGVLA